jgi:hypothetical protein
MTTYPRHRTHHSGPFVAALVALSIAMAMLSITSIRGSAPGADAVPAATPAPGF